jgi:DNA-binding response OmpR family regulator
MDILIVDDEMVMRSLIALAIQRKGYSVTSVATPAQALEYLDTTTPELIILDVMMPQVDGITFCRRLRSHSATEQIPIIMFSALGDERTKLNALNAGATHYCHKLTMYDDLFTMVHDSLEAGQVRRCKQPLTTVEEAAVQAGPNKLH